MSDHEPDDRPPVPPTPWQPPADSGPSGSPPPASAPPESGPPPLPGPPTRSEGDQPPAPGWWKASDGNWYPPHQHPRYQQQPQEPLVPPPPGQPAGYQSYGDQYGGNQYGGQVYGGYQTYAGPPPSNGLATASLVLGIISILLFWSFGFGVLLGILAIIFGVMGNNKAKDLPGQPLAGRAKAGLVTGIIGTIGGVIFFVFIFAAVGEAIDDIEAETRDGFCNPDNFFDPDC